MREWRVRMGYDIRTDDWIFYASRECDDGGVEFLEIEQGELISITISADTPIRPWMRFNGNGQGLIAGLASALAQNGYGALQATPQVLALEKHVASLEKQAERLFTLAAQ